IRSSVPFTPSRRGVPIANVGLSATGLRRANRSIAASIAPGTTGCRDSKTGDDARRRLPMRVSEVMTKGAECTHPDATVREAAIRMQTLDVGSLPVCENDRLIGMVTDRDMTVRTTAAGADPNDARVRDAMTPQIHFCFEDQDIADAARLMKEKQIRRL